jgi:hypothetical protein
MPVYMLAGTDAKSQHRETSKASHLAMNSKISSLKLCQDFQIIQNDQTIELNWIGPSNNPILFHEAASSVNGSFQFIYCPVLFRVE